MRLALLGVLGVLVACGGESGPPRSGGYPAGGPGRGAHGEAGGAIPVPPDDGSWSLLERQQWQALSREVTAKYLNSVNEYCHVRLDAWFDFESFRHHFTKDAAHPLDDATMDHVRGPFQGLIELCSGGGTSNGSDPEMNRRAVAAKVHRIDVHWAPPAAGFSRVAVGSGIVSVTINPADGLSFPDFADQNRKELLHSL